MRSSEQQEEITSVASSLTHHSRKGQPIRVLHCPGTAVGNATGLARAERELGLKSWSVALYPSPFWNDVDEDLSHLTGVTRERKRWQLLWRALRQYDVVHFNLGLSILPWRPYDQAKASLPRRMYRRALDLRDLPLLKWAGKGIVVTYQGDDARQGDFCAAHFEVNAVAEAGPDHYSPQSDARKRARIATFGKYADVIYGVNPDLLYILPKQARFLPYSHVDPRAWPAVGKASPNSSPPVVLHAPSNRRLKGTRFILDAVERLKAEGVPLEFVLVEGLPNTEARRLYERADLLVDQLLFGWYGGLAVELMALGKPVICYIRESDLQFIPQGMKDDIPIIQATPNTIYEVLKRWLTARKADLPATGMKSRTYVERWHDPLKIAAQTKADYEAILTAKEHRAIRAAA